MNNTQFVSFNMIFQVTLGVYLLNNSKNFFDFSALIRALYYSRAYSYILTLSINCGGVRNQLPMIPKVFSYITTLIDSVELKLVKVSIRSLLDMPPVEKEAHVTPGTMQSVLSHNYRHHGILTPKEAKNTAWVTVVSGEIQSVWNTQLHLSAGEAECDIKLVFKLFWQDVNC